MFQSSVKKREEALSEQGLEQGIERGLIKGKVEDIENMLK